MIRLEVEGYCQQCMDFSPEVTKAKRLLGPEGEDLGYLGHTVVRCEHRQRCANIKRYLERQAKGETV